MDSLKTYEYLEKARGRVLEAIRPLTSEQYFREFGFGLKTIGSTLSHIMISEWYYIERLQGRAVPPYEQWPIQYERPPKFGVVDAAWREQAGRVRAAIAAERDWNRNISYDTFADEQGRRYHISATAGDVYTQLVLHEVHHRAQIMAMLRMLGGSVTPVQDIDYNDLTYERRPLA